MCLLLSSLLGFDGFGGRKTKVRNLTEEPLYLQIRVGVILRKVYRLDPGCTKTLSCSNICSKYYPRNHDTFYYDETCEPYVWFHTDAFAAWCSAKQQYASLADLEACRVISVCQDSIKPSFSVIRMYR